MSYTNMKASRDTTISKLLDAAEKAGGGNEKKSYGDDRKWKPTVDKAGNGYAVLRFLPAVEGQDVPWVRYWDHGFKGPTGRWYIEKSLTSIGKEDPVSELNSQLWNSGIEEDKNIARARKRRLHYVSNVYIVSDPSNPENEGKVFLYQYGKKIFDKLMAAMQPEFEDETPINPFDFWEGANFKLKIRKVDGYWNYDKSEFGAKSKLLDNDEEIEKVWEKQYPLNEFTAATNFKSYEELKTRLDAVLSGTVSVGNVEEEMVDEPIAQPKVDTKEVKSDSDEDTMDYFQKLASEG